MKTKERDFWLTVNQRVAGSSPAKGAKTITEMWWFFVFISFSIFYKSYSTLISQVSGLFG